MVCSYHHRPLEGPFLNNTVIKKCSKESNKKCLEITEGSLLFHCQNRPNAKVFSERIVTCHFYPLVGLSYSAYVFRTAYQVSFVSLLLLRSGTVVQVEENC